MCNILQKKKKEPEFSNLYRQKFGEHVWEWIVRMWDNGIRNIKLDQAKFINTDWLSSDSAFHFASWGVRKGANNLVGWLAKTWTKRWPTVSKLEMLDRPCFTVEEGIQRLRETEMLEWICHLRPTHPPWDSPKDTLFITTMRNQFVRGVPTALKCSVACLSL